MLRVRHEKDILRQPARGDAYSTPEIVYGGCQSKIPCELQESPVFWDFPVSWGLARGVRRAEKDPAKESFRPPDGPCLPRCRSNSSPSRAFRPETFPPAPWRRVGKEVPENVSSHYYVAYCRIRFPGNLQLVGYGSLPYMAVFRHKKAFRSWSGKPVKWKKAQFYSSSSASKAESSESKSASRWAVNFFTRWAAGSGASTICMVLPARRGG